MSVNGISDKMASSEPVRDRKRGESKTSPTNNDAVELSSEAKALFKSAQEKKLEEIREKVAKGFYFQDDVTEKVADLLVDVLKGSPDSGKA